ncbi:MAG TPA: lipoyl(octanoyl) transferase LipB [Candidatus Nitrosopolaris sp.]|nr:lipoyl(octanoyl) transferase LipB [Candidatus Nitrosopolaris sp.]
MQLEVGVLGQVDYQRALVLQEALVARRLAGGADAMLLLEHPPVYTLGRGGDPCHLGGAATTGVPIVRAQRGGQVTYHGPGQLVGYPVLGLRDLRPDVGWYVRGLEEVLIRVLADLQVAADRRPGLAGVWCGARKIASVGVAIRRWVTWHGFALNVGRDLSGFAAITPCGIAGVEMTSVEAEGGPGDIAAVIPLVVSRFVSVFGYGGWRPLEGTLQEAIA